MVVDRIFLQLGSFPATGHLALSLLVPADDLPVDVSGLKLIRSQQAFDRLLGCLQDIVSDSRALHLLEIAAPPSKIRTTLSQLRGSVFLAGLTSTIAPVESAIITGLFCVSFTLLRSVISSPDPKVAFGQALSTNLREFVEALPVFVSRVESAGNFPEAEHLLT